MRRNAGQFGFTLVEMVVVIATILILASVFLGVGKYLTVRASIDLTASELEVLATALQQYYDDFEAFPFITNVSDSDSDGYWLDEFIGEYLAVQGTIPMDIDFESSAALFYHLQKNTNTRMIINAMTDSLVTNKDASDINVQITLSATGEQVDLSRFIDAWGTSIRYEYADGTAFPVLTSAGPDEVFDTSDDVTSQ